MIKRVFKPFWSYDVVATENYLNLMARKGYHLSDINFFLRLFTFETNAPSSTRYRIAYAPQSNGSVPEGFFKTGYENVFWNNRYLVLKYTQLKAGASPSYDSFRLKNKRIFDLSAVLLALLAIPMICFLFYLLIMVILINLSSSSFEQPIAITGSNPAEFLLHTLLTVLIIGFFIWLIYTVVRLHKSNKKLSELCRPSAYRIHDFSEHMRFQRLDDSIKTDLMGYHEIKRVYRYGWFYSMDKTAEWLEEMELNGYHLYRVSRVFGIFYFVKHPPRKIKVFIENIKHPDQAHVHQKTQEGWTLLYYSSYIGEYQNLIWSKQYDDVVPEFNCDIKKALNRAKTVMLWNVIPSLVLLMVNLLIFVAELLLNKRLYFVFLSSLNPVLLSLLIFSPVQSTRYYLRLKKLQKQTETP